ncbi:MAG: hypothetical protein ACXABL_10140 [Candidatus Thorarchaeota archaeon]|jgi:sporulation protein YlmC with PRC-barrel domain
MDVTRSLNCKDLKKRDVVDSKFTFDGDLKLSQFILAGSALEEFLESVKVKPDKDPVFDGGLIEKLGDKIQLNTTSNALKTTLDKDAIPTGQIRLSELEKMDIIDKGGVKVGRAIDIDFDVDGSASLTVGGGFIEESLEAIGLKSDVDIIVPAAVIDSVSNNIKLSVSKDELGLTLDEALKSSEVVKARAEHKDDVIKVRLYAHRLF